MNNSYIFTVLHLKSEQTRGLAPITIKAKPLRIAITEAKYEVSILLLEQIWQTLLEQRGKPPQEEFEYLSVILNDYEWHCERTEKQMILSVQKSDGSHFTQPVTELCNLLNSFTIDPNQFLRLTVAQQYAEVEKICAFAQPERLAKFFDLKLQNNKVMLQGKPINLTKAGQRDLIKLAIAVNSIKNPSLQIIKINHWLLLNPAHMKFLEQIATEMDYLLWFTMGVCAGK